MRPFVVRVDHVPPEGETFALRVEATVVAARLDADAATGLAPVGEVIAEARLLPSGDDVFVLGRLQGRVRGECSRCLEPFEECVAAEFHLVFVHELPAADGGETELHREDLELELLHGNSIDLGEVVAEQFQLALPPHPVCDEACRGLCPLCGGNRNQSACDCGDREFDPRFAVLASLRRIDDESDH